MGVEGKKIDLAVTTVYSSQEKQWLIKVISKDGAITFGEYRVSDATGEVTSTEVIGAQILQPSVTCADPASRLTQGPVPPRILIPSTATATPIPAAVAALTATPTPSPTPAPVIGSKDEAQARVWVEAYNCYGVFPELTSFIAYAYSAGKWVVEGKTATTHYGLWQVDSSTGNITPLDLVAAQAAAKCNLAAPVSLSPAVTAEQAEIRVWITLYDCYPPSKPRRTSFKAYGDNRQRWLVEGTATETVGTITQTISYGLWSVDTTTAAITPWDGEARLKANAACYQKP